MRNASTWLRLDTWLSDIAQVPMRHLLVVLDACHSGVALDPTVRWRGKAIGVGGPLGQLGMRRSRRIITSALDNEFAMDSGPIAGHSLFTGCLIEALTGGLLGNAPSAVVTGTDIGRYIQRRVIDYPNSKQTPDFGALELDDRGELIVRLAVPVDESQHEPGTRSPTAVVFDVDGDRFSGTGDAPNATPSATMESSSPAESAPAAVEPMRETARVVRDESLRQKHRSSKLVGIVFIGLIIGGMGVALSVLRQSSGLPGAGHDTGSPVTRNAAPPPAADAGVGATVANDAARPAIAVPTATAATPEPSATPSKPIPRRFVRRGRELIAGKDCTTERDPFLRPPGLPPCPPASPEDSSTSAAGVVQDKPAAGVVQHKPVAEVVQDTLFKDRR